MTSREAHCVGPWAARRAAVVALARAGGWILLLGLGCITPTLPPDDPPEPDVELGVGVVRLHGHVGVGPSFVLAHNRASGLVFGERTATGAYDFEVVAERCDLLAFWYTLGAFQSPAITFRPAEVVGRRGECLDAPSEVAEGDAGP